MPRDHTKYTASCKTKKDLPAKREVQRNEQVVLQTYHRKGNIFLSQRCEKKNSYTKSSNRGILPVGKFTNSLLSIVIIHY